MTRMGSPICPPRANSVMNAGAIYVCSPIFFCLMHVKPESGKIKKMTHYWSADITHPGGERCGRKERASRVKGI